ncbi:MAG: STAS domain-containing protein [Candidatus Eremiobacteraeota bacterium]|nr:STAS domain-containing protein [Candidatus Eremiobacteraeota bacterium]
MEPVVIEYRPQLHQPIEAAVVAAVQNGAGRVVLDLDALDTLDTEGVRGLIEILRQARSIGGELALRATRPDVLRTLSVTALDKIFPLAAPQVA